MHPDAPSLAEQTAPRGDTQAHLVASLTEQLAAGQSETLYSLHTAGARLRRQAEALEAAVRELPEELAPGLQAQVAEMVGGTTEAIQAATESLSERLSQWETVLDRVVQSHEATLAEGTKALEAGLAAGKKGLDEAAKLMTAQTVEAVEQIADAATTAAAEVKAGFEASANDLKTASSESQAAATIAAGYVQAAAAEAQQVIVDATTKAAAEVQQGFDAHATDLTTAVNQAQQQFTEAAQAASEQLERAATDANASADAITAVGENVIARLIEVLDVRDKADRALEDRLNARIDRLTKRAETTINRLIGALADEADVLRYQLEQERVHNAQLLSDLVDRLLAQPRGKLKDLKKETSG